MMPAHVDGAAVLDPIGDFARRVEAVASLTDGRNGALTRLAFEGGGLVASGAIASEGALRGALYAAGRTAGYDDAKIGSIVEHQIEAGKARPFGAPAPATAIEWLGAAELARPLGPVPWLVQALDLCPGAPALLAGYGFSGKTIAAQSMALSIASGRPAWGALPCRQGAVRHLDFEQGARLTAERYQRLARGMSVDLALLPLACAVLPRVDLGAVGSDDVLARACEGAALVIVDSLRACAPHVDENSSEVRRVLDLLGRVSEKTAAAFLVIHHARKPSKDDKGGAQMAIRGSGAIFDACSSVLVFSAEKGEPVTVSHEKARTSGTPCDAFGLEVADVTGPEGDPRWGLAVRHIGSDVAAARTAEKRTAADRDLEAQIRAFVATNAGPGISGKTIRASVAGSTDAIRNAIARLELRGDLMNTGTDARPNYQIAPSDPLRARVQK